VETPHICEEKILKSQASAGNEMLHLFRECNGPTLEQYLNQGTIVTAATYNEMLK